MTSPLANLTGHGRPLAAEPPDADEFAGLKHSGLARLQDAQIDGLSLEGQFDLIYNASHALCLAALRWHGYVAFARTKLSGFEKHTLGKFNLNRDRQMVRMGVFQHTGILQVQ